MASITKIKIKSGVSYRVAWRVGNSEDGERRNEYKSFDRLEDARRHRREMEEQVEFRRVGSIKA